MHCISVQRFLKLPVVTPWLDFGCPFLIGLLSRCLDDWVRGAAIAKPVSELKENIEDLDGGDLDFGRFGVLGFDDGVFGLGVFGTLIPLAVVEEAVLGIPGVLGAPIPLAVVEEAVLEIPGVFGFGVLDFDEGVLGLKLRGRSIT